MQCVCAHYGLSDSATDDVTLPVTPPILTITITLHGNQNRGVTSSGALSPVRQRICASSTERGGGCDSVRQINKNFKLIFL